MPLTTRLSQYISQNELFDQDDKLLVAVSGGIDSTTLLHLLAEGGYKVAIAHCNFGLRGEESDGDEALVRRLQSQYGIKGYYILFDTEKEAANAGESIQMAARRLRYNWFNQLCNEKGYRYIAIAHNADDVAETFFLNLARGTGLKGLTGIKPKTGRVVRPLLFATRQEIVEYANFCKIEHREDSTNAKDKYARNRIRLNVVPELKKINPGFNHTMLENISRLQMVEDLVTQEVNTFKQNAVTATPTAQHISIAKLLENKNSKLLLYEFLCFYGFNSSQLDAIFKSIESGVSGSRFFGRDHILLRDRDELILYATNQEQTAGYYQIHTDTTSIDSPISLKLESIEKVPETTFSKLNSVAYLDYERLHFPLILRKWQNGDEFTPFGMKGRKKLSDFFIDQKMSIHEKENQWLLCSGNDVVWVVGRRSDDRYKVTEETQNILRIETTD